MPGRVLVVDDEAQIRSLVRAYLEADGLEVLEAGTGAEALRLLTGVTDHHIDIVLLDIGLPDLDGLEVLRRVRATASEPRASRRSEVYVVLLTARAEEIDTVVGLSVGADDYVTKPFSPREVVARVKAALRRLAGPAATGHPNTHPGPRSGDVEAPDDPLRFEGLLIDPQRREVTRDGRPVSLSALEFDLLAALAGEPGRVFSRHQLLDRVWDRAFYGDERVVDVHIRSIRLALGDDARDPRVVATVRGVGYKFLPAPQDPPP